MTKWEGSFTMKKLRRATKEYPQRTQTARGAVRRGHRGEDSSRRGPGERMKECSGARRVERHNEENDHASQE